MNPLSLLDAGTKYKPILAVRNLREIQISTGTQTRRFNLSADNP
jgi:hypothetical protein